MKKRGFITDQIVFDLDFTCQILHSQVARNFPNRSPKPKTTKKTNKLTPILRTIRRESNLSFFGFIDYGVDLSFFLDLLISELKKTNEKNRYTSPATHLLVSQKPKSLFSSSEDVKKNT